MSHEYYEKINEMQHEIFLSHKNMEHIFNQEQNFKFFVLNFTRRQTVLTKPAVTTVILSISQQNMSISIPYNTSTNKL